MSPRHISPSHLTVLHGGRSLKELLHVPAAEVRDKLEQRKERKAPKGCERVTRVGSGCTRRGRAMVGGRRVGRVWGAHEHWELSAHSLPAFRALALLFGFAIPVLLLCFVYASSLSSLLLTLLYSISTTSSSCRPFPSSCI
jgi:hypothetical protein